ncbi:MAG TPA: N,N-dimethylformamidase beta subunit family domain-containing protein [Streptosporangiaceae bacterium]|nr:N,N-dimethylformamidase beta subunit family domain-containing protein [Streptosporangiaceae bacterium]
MKRTADVELLGYAQPCVVHPGGTIDVKVSCALPEFTAEVIRLGLDAGAAPEMSLGRFPGRRQDLAGGSYFLAELGAELPGPAGHTATLWFRPALLNAPQCLVAGLSAGGGWELGIGEDRRVGVVRLDGDGQHTGRRVSAGPELDTGRWYFAAASWDTGGGVSLLVLPRAPGGAFRIFSARQAGAQAHDLGRPVPATRTISVAAAVTGRTARRCFNGKIDTPRLFDGALSEADLAALAADAPAARVRGLRHEWRFTPDAALPPHRVRDCGPGRRDGSVVNSPVLGVTGRNWTPGTESFLVRPDEYAAATFHEDDLADAGWETSLSLRVPDEWRSGAYGVRLRAGGDGDEDVVPVIVSAAGCRRPDGPAAAVLLPTFSYLAYANEHASWEHPIASAGEASAMPVTDRDRFMARHRLLSLYDLHPDGTGCCLSSWRRPVLNMRPGYHLPLIGGPHQFSADLELLHWLESRQVDVDVITDDDLHTRGVDALAPYRVVLTGSHPEYTSTQMLDALDGYMNSGGRLMYLGGNGFYWVTTAPQDDPYLIEVRRGQAGTRVWESEPGEWHQAMTGERGGLWRHRGRQPQSLTGVGFTGQGFDVSLPYRVLADPGDPRAGFILDGIDPGLPLGGAGSVLGGPAGFEIDRAEAALGTPSHAVVVASASGFSNAYQGAVEDVTTADSLQGGPDSALVRSDVVFFETVAGGAVFSVGSIAWCGALRAGRDETPVGRLTWNVLHRFVDEAPFAPPGHEQPLA